MVFLYFRLFPPVLYIFEILTLVNMEGTTGEKTVQLKKGQGHGEKVEEADTS